MENAQPGKYKNGKCTTWKMTKNAHPDKWRKTTPENARMEMAHPGNWQKNHPLENDRKCTSGICQNGKYTFWKMPEWKLLTLENDRKIRPQKIPEKSDLKNARVEIEHPVKYQDEKCTTWRIPEWK